MPIVVAVFFRRHPPPPPPPPPLPISARCILKSQWQLMSKACETAIPHRMRENLIDLTNTVSREHYISRMQNSENRPNVFERLLFLLVVKLQDSTKLRQRAIPIWVWGVNFLYYSQEWYLRLFHRADISLTQATRRNGLTSSLQHHPTCTISGMTR